MAEVKDASGPLDIVVAMACIAGFWLIPAAPAEATRESAGSAVCIVEIAPFAAGIRADRVDVIPATVAVAADTEVVPAMTLETKADNCVCIVVMVGALCKGPSTALIATAGCGDAPKYWPTASACARMSDRPKAPTPGDVAPDIAAVPAPRLDSADVRPAAPVMAATNGAAAPPSALVSADAPLEVALVSAEFAAPVGSDSTALGPPESTLDIAEEIDEAIGPAAGGGFVATA